MEYDVIVVGAGPGGSTAAYQAAQMGGNVLMIEKRNAVGEPVRCAEGISKEVKERFEIPEKVIANAVEWAEIISPRKESIILEGHGYILERISSDKFLAQRAIESGAELKTKMRVVGVSKNEDGFLVKAVSPEGLHKWQAKNIIGADGRESNVGRWLGIDTSLRLDQIDKAFQYEMITSVEKNKIMLFLGNEFAPGGYAWIFPKGEKKANIGLCIPGDFKKTAKELLDIFLAKEKIEGSVTRVSSGTIPMTDPSHPICGEGFALVGDAGRFVNPIHGGGMAEAMVSGELAGKLAVEDEIEKFAKLAENMKKRNRKLAKLNSFVKQLNDDDLDFLIKRVSKSELQGTMGGNLKTIAKLAKERPSLIKHIPKLL